MKRLGTIMIILLMSAVFVSAAPTYEIEDMASNDVCDIIQFNYYLGFNMASQYRSERCDSVVNFTASLVVQNIKYAENKEFEAKAIANVQKYQKVLVKSLKAGCKRSRKDKDIDIKVFLAENGIKVCANLLKSSDTPQHK